MSNKEFIIKSTEDMQRVQVFQIGKTYGRDSIKETLPLRSIIDKSELHTIVKESAISAINEMFENEISVTDLRKIVFFINNNSSINIKLNIFDDGDF